MNIKEICTCNGEAHDECRPCTDCGEVSALNTYDEANSWWCDDCWEAMVEAEEASHRQRIAEQGGIR